MIKTSQQIAEELARKCALDTGGLYSVTCIEKRILQSIPLVELVELREILRMENELLGWKQADDLLDNLTTKLKQLGIEV